MRRAIDLSAMSAREIRQVLEALMRESDAVALDLAERHHDSWDASGTDVHAADAPRWSVGGSSPPAHHLDRDPTALERWGRALGLLLCCVSAMLTLGLAWYALEGWLR